MSMIGLPNPNYFPYDTLEAKVALPNRWTPRPNDPVDPPITRSTSRKDKSPAEARLLVPKSANTPDVLRKIDLTTALQYGTAQGYPPLYQFLTEFTRDYLHPNVPYKGGPEIILTVGNTDGFAKCMQAFAEEWHEGEDPPSERQGCLVEEYAYMNAIQQVQSKGLNVVPVRMDEGGMTTEGPGGLRDVLENWDFSKGKMPHLMYTVTIGQNPTGAVLSVQRRKEIYALCCKYDIIICEDDPYWYLQYPGGGCSNNYNTAGGGKSSGFPYLDSLVPSYLSMDYEGRVVRMDTFSKTVAPGCRLGWITAQPALVERILRITETSTQQPSGFVQAMIAELIMGPPDGPKNGSGGAKDGKGWRFDGWVRWLEGLRGEYQRRMETMCGVLSAGKTIMKSGRRSSLSQLTADLNVNDGDRDEWSVIEQTKIYDFVRPLGGMFLWVRFDFGTHPLSKQVPGPRLARALWIYFTTDAYKVLVGPGTMFAPTQEIKERDAWECFRLCFAAAETHEIEEFSKRFVRGAKGFWKIKDKQVIDDLLAEDEVEMLDASNAMGNLAGFC
ncbi:hypothetical protein, variant [Verruconis gallopava]|uniref:Aminotransferase class I/classII large domain-containing protein n=1 Tax=Verruconis gallopava TaxID=253628 RepID=A0A0D1YL44_9PEZI|nr:hypothetical protein, variant [Verruconis gallopava]KIW01507.1 hypothetical protein, variant [Verruconis gallopava]